MTVSVERRAYSHPPTARPSRTHRCTRWLLPAHSERNIPFAAIAGLNDASCRSLWDEFDREAERSRQLRRDVRPKSARYPSSSLIGQNRVGGVDRCPQGASWDAQSRMMDVLGSMVMACLLEATAPGAPSSLTAACGKFTGDGLGCAREDPDVNGDCRECRADLDAAPGEAGIGRQDARRLATGANAAGWHPPRPGHPFGDPARPA